MTTDNNADVILEQNQRLSQSIIWQLQHNYFNQQGVEAWRSGAVPHYITSNPFVADAYAKVVMGFLRDCQINSFYNSKQPLYIVELGAGSGRFSYHFLSSLLKMHQQAALKDIAVTYVMTDIAQSSLHYWAAHPKLTPLVEQGVLDFALFEAGQDGALSLSQSGLTLTPDTVQNPMVVIANYLFDSIPQDCFYIKGHRIFESLVTVSSPKDEPDLSDPSLIERIKIRYEHQPTTASYYEQKELNQLLRHYQHHLNDTTLLFPYAAMNCIRHFCQLSAERLLLISGDKGYIREEGLHGWEDQQLTVHGSFSMMVNYHAIAQYIQNRGGQVLQTDHHHESLNVSAFLVGQPPIAYTETQHAYQSAINQFGPDDFFVLKQGLQKNYEALTPHQILAYLRLSDWDTSVFMGAFSVLNEGLAEADESLKQDIYAMTSLVWEKYYPIGESEDTAFHLGMLLYGLDYYEEALAYFQQSLASHGLEASTAYNISLCYYGLVQMDKALEWIEETLDLDPAFDGAANMWRQIQKKVNP